MATVPARHTTWRLAVAMSAAALAIGAAGATMTERLGHDSLADFERRVVQKGHVRVSNVLSGTLMPARRVTVAAEFPAHVREVLVARSESVKAGQSLLRLDSAAVALQRAHRIAELERAAARLRAMRAKGPDADAADLRDAQVSYELARLELAEAERVFEARTVKSPIAGVVVQLNARAGDPVSPAAPLLVVADTSSYVAEVEADEYDVSEIAAGRPAAVFVDALPNSVFEGHVSEAPTVRRFRSGPGSSTSYVFNVDLSHPAAPLQPGMSARVEIDSDGTGELALVPLAALVAIEKSTYVIVDAGGGNLRAARVYPGRANADFVEVADLTLVGRRVVIGEPRALRQLMSSARGE